MIALEGMTALVVLLGEPVAANPAEELTPQLRAAKVAWHLACGEGLRTRDVARMTGLTIRGAHGLLALLSDKLPIYQDRRGVWQRCEMRELEA